MLLPNCNLFSTKQSNSSLKIKSDHSRPANAFLSHLKAQMVSAAPNPKSHYYLYGPQWNSCSGHTGHFTVLATPLAASTSGHWHLLFIRPEMLLIPQLLTWLTPSLDSGPCSNVTLSERPPQISECKVAHHIVLSILSPAF